MIRAAHLGDMPGIYILGRRAHMQSDDRLISMDQAKARTTVANMIGSKDALVLVDEVDGLIKGVLIGYADDLWWSNRRFAVPLLIFAERPGALMYMVRRFLRWAFDQKRAVQVPLDCSFGGALGAKTVEIFRRVAARDRRLGLEEVGASFIVRRDL